MTKIIQKPYYLNLDLEISRLYNLDRTGMSLNGLPFYRISLTSGEEVGRCQPKNVILDLSQSQLLEFYHWVLENRLSATSDELVRHDTSLAQEIGRKLFNFLVTQGNDAESWTPTEMGEVFHAAVESSLNEGRGIRLRLTLVSPELQNYPWEYLCLPGEPDFLTIDHRFALVRHINYKRRPRRPPVPKKIRMLGLIGADLPEAKKPKREKWLAEMQRLRDLLLAKQPNFEFIIEPDLTASKLDTYLSQNQFNIIHYFGHGDFEDDPKVAQGYLLLQGNEAKPNRVYGDALLKILSSQTNLALVSLYACHTATTRNGDRFSSVAASLNREVPTVTAMQFAANDKIAYTHCKAFYNSLLEGEDVEHAVCRARHSVYLEMNQADFGIHVLYSRTQAPVQLFAKVPPPNEAPCEPPKPTPTDPSPADGATLLYLFEAQLNELLSQLEKGSTNSAAIKNKLKEYARLAGKLQNLEVGEVIEEKAGGLQISAPAQPDLYRQEAEVLVAQGQQFFADGGDQYYAAVGLFQIATTKDKENVEAWLGLGRGQLKLEKVQDALLSLQRAYKLAPQRLDICLELAEAYRLSRNEIEALKYLDKAMLLQPKHPVAYARRGDYYYADQEWELAAHNYTTALKYKSKDLEIRLKRANCYYSMTHLPEAFEDYRYYYDKSPDKDSENCRLALARVRELVNRIYNAA